MATCATCGLESNQPFKFCPECGTPIALAPPREERKTVTVLFCDVAGSTALGEALDPEAVRALLARYFERMKAIVESHGGVVEKFIGDAVMAVFGVPTVHEDDALRAVRAAADMRAALPGLGVNGRIGVATGVVVTGTHERLATGDTVNVAKRLEESAPLGEVFVAEGTVRRVRDAVEVDAGTPLAVKGKAEPVRAYRLLGVHERRERGDTPFVGRERELAAIAEAWHRVRNRRQCELLTVVGEAGIGKSRLVAEALSRSNRLVVRGRCLPYGSGITYWPVVEVLKQLDTRPPDAAAAAAIAALLGESEERTSAEEITWAFGRALEHVADQRALVCVFDDIHLGEDTFLDLVDHLAAHPPAAPILLLALARPELIERRPGWTVALHLDPLRRENVDELFPDELGGALRETIARVAAGNPLFVTEMLAMLAAGEETPAVPPNLEAVLAARLDQLERPLREVVDCAAVEGEVFHRSALESLAQDDGALASHLSALVRKRLFQAERPLIAGDEAFRFRHVLIRDVAYQGLTKSRRAELHEQLADWLEREGTDVVELDELVGHHLERAATCKAELGTPDLALAERGGKRLASAGRKAAWRGDRAARGLLDRALTLMRPLRFDVHLELELASAHTDPRRAAATARDVADRAHAVGDASAEALARVVEAQARSEFSANPAFAEVEALARAAAPALERAEDHAGLVIIWRALGTVANSRGQFEQWTRTSEHAMRHARLAGERRDTVFGFAYALVFGPRPADVALDELDDALPENPHPTTFLARAELLAMLGRFDEAIPLAQDADTRLRELLGDAGGEPELAEIARFAGDDAGAIRFLETYCAYLERRGARAGLSTYAAALGRLLCLAGRVGDAERLANSARDLGDEYDALTQVGWRQAQALVSSSRHDHVAAHRLAREAVAHAYATDALTLQGDALCDLARVLEAAGDTVEAREAFEQALDRYERKKNLALAARVRPHLEQLLAPQ